MSGLKKGSNASSRSVTSQYWLCGVTVFREQDALNMKTLLLRWSWNGDKVCTFDLRGHVNNTACGGNHVEGHSVLHTHYALVAGATEHSMGCTYGKSILRDESCH